MITGDKGDAAQQIAINCGFFNSQEKLHLIEGNKISIYEKVKEVSELKDENYGVLLSGYSLPLIFKNKNLK